MSSSSSEDADSDAAVVAAMQGDGPPRKKQKIPTRAPTRKPPKWSKAPDPPSSRSDWTIQVIWDEDAADDKESGDAVHGEQHIDTYHVHTCFLADGEDASRYFVKQFDRDYAENAAKTTRVKIHPLAANAFPVFLDYLYGIDFGQDPDDDDDDDDDGGECSALTTENATALSFLADYFDIEGLAGLVKAFYDRDLDTKNLMIYYQHAKILRVDSVMTGAIKKCTSAIHNDGTDIEEVLSVEQTDVFFWQQVLERSHLEYKEKAKVTDLSRWIQAFCLARRDEMDLESFLELTDAKLLPKVDSSIALQLLDLEHKHITVVGEGAIDDNDPLTSLQQRCVDALSSDYKKIVNKDLETETILSRLNPKLVVVLQANALDKHASALERATKKNQGYKKAAKKAERKYDKLKRLSGQMVRYVKVQNAGTAAVNGYYYLVDGASREDVRYCREGMWQGHRRKFHVMKTDEDTWCICVTPVGEMPSSSSEKVYSRDVSSVDKIEKYAAPYDGWQGQTNEVSCVGQTPAPTVTFDGFQHDRGSLLVATLPASSSD